MSLFKRANETRAPAGRVQLPAAGDLERFGRSEYDPEENRWPWPSSAVDFLVPTYSVYQADPDGFLTSLADVAEQTGGWSAYGAEKLLFELGDVNKEHPAYTRIMDATLTFLRSHGVPPKLVTDRELGYWQTSGGTIDTWLTLRPMPAQSDAPIAALGPGQTRRLAQLNGNPESRVYLVQLTRDGRYCWMVDSRNYDTDSERTRWVHQTSESLYELYIDIGLNLQTPPHWVDSELEPYIPLPRPTL